MSATVLVVLGPAGSGKSTIARRIARLRRAAYLDKDALLAEFVAAMMTRAGRRPDDRESDGFYREEILPLEYRALWRAATACAELGTEAVIDAPFLADIHDPGYLRRALAEAGRPATPVTVVQLVTPGNEVRERLIRRGNPRDAWKLAHWDEFWAAHGEVRCAWSGCRILRVENGTAAPGDDELAALLADPEPAAEDR